MKESHSHENGNSCHLGMVTMEVKWIAGSDRKEDKKGDKRIQCVVRGRAEVSYVVQEDGLAKISPKGRLAATGVNTFKTKDFKLVNWQ